VNAATASGFASSIIRPALVKKTDAGN